MLKHIIINFLFLVAALCFHCCKPPAPTGKLVPLPAALDGLPLDSTIPLGAGIFITRVSEKSAVLVTPPSGPRKVKYKNIGNNHSKAKNSGNADAFNKNSANSGSLNDTHKSGNTDLKKVDNAQIGNSGSPAQVQLKPPDANNNTNSGIPPVLKTVFWCLFLIILIIIIYRVIKVFT